MKEKPLFASPRWLTLCFVGMLGCGSATQSSSDALEADASTQNDGTKATSSATTSPTTLPWVGTWATAPQSTTKSFQDQTLRQIVHTSIAGSKARIHFSNAFGTQAITIQAVYISPVFDGATIDPTTQVPVTFNKAVSVTIAKGGRLQAI